MPTKILAFLLAAISLTTAADLSADFDEVRARYGDELNSRFILSSDPIVDSLASISLRDSWWSRPHEYAWALQFAGHDCVVLDAACGISHPFKWALGETCQQTWACDSDTRISDRNQLLQETYDDLGYSALNVLIDTPRLIEQVNLVQGSICEMSASMPQFDRIFCISTLEHLDTKDQKSALKEFARFLAPEGLLILTVDYPEVTPQKLISMAEEAGLIPAGEVELEKPANGYLTNSYLSIYRCVFTHQADK